MVQALSTRATDALAPLRNWWGRQPSRRRTGYGVGTLLVLIIALFAVMAYALFGPKFHNDTYRDYIVDANGGDLPAPPFIGWAQETLEEPPAELKPDETVTNLNKEQCRPGGELSNDLERVPFQKIKHWSGAQMYNNGHGAKVEVDVTNQVGPDYSAVDKWISECGFTQFDHGDETVRITHKTMDGINWGTWSLSDGRMFTQTVATSTANGFAGNVSTVTVMGNAPGYMARIKLTFRGRVDDNALQTMDMLWTAQIAKLDKELKRSVKN